MFEFLSIYLPHKNDGNIFSASKTQRAFLFEHLFDVLLNLSYQYFVSKFHRVTEQTMNKIRNSICQF